MARATPDRARRQKRCCNPVVVQWGWCGFEVMDHHRVTAMCGRNPAAPVVPGAVVPIRPRCVSGWVSVRPRELAEPVEPGAARPTPGGVLRRPVRVAEWARAMPDDVQPGWCLAAMSMAWTGGRPGRTQERATGASRRARTCAGRCSTAGRLPLPERPPSPATLLGPSADPSGNTLARQTPGDDRGDMETAMLDWPGCC